MSFIMQNLPRIPDALANTANTTYVNNSASDTAEKEPTALAAGEKLQSDNARYLDKLDLSGAISLDGIRERLRDSLTEGDIAIGQGLEILDRAPLGRQDFVTFTGEASEKAQALAAQMAEYPRNVPISIGGLSMEQLAELCGGIGKEMDGAFAAGEISA